jgi:hypothetical protein
VAVSVHLTIRHTRGIRPDSGSRNQNADLGLWQRLPALMQHAPVSIRSDGSKASDSGDPVRVDPRFRWTGGRYTGAGRLVFGRPDGIPPGSGAQCPATGTGALNENVVMPVRSLARFVLTADIQHDPEVTVIQEARVDPPTGIEDPNPANNVARDIDPIGLFGDGFEGEEQA